MTIRLDKSVRREIEIRAIGRPYVVEISKAGIFFREKGRRFTIALPWRDALARAEHLAGELAHRERLRDRAIARRRA